ncbi:MAG TPA: hypothetical protein VFQ91_03770 [Bryobacteraceae bacterium]|nr:hypothetical protein [Bryobacteraceae bacterium]
MAITAIIVLGNMADVYTSEATLAVVRQQIPERFVAPLSEQTIAEELITVKTEVLSRKRVLEIVANLNLYPKLRQKLAPEEVVDVMRQDVKIEPMGGGRRGEVDSFRISYTTNNPQLAQSVTAWLTRLFIEEDLRTRGTQADTTLRFINERLEVAKQRLAEQEDQLRKYKMLNLGSLPEQQQINQSAMADLRTHLQDVSAGLNRTRQQRVMWESMLRGKIAAVQSDRSSLLSRFTPRHPEVVKKDKEVATMEEFAALLKNDETPAATLPAPQSDEDPFIAQLRGQIESNFSETEDLRRSAKTLRAQVGQYQARLNTSPIKEQELATIQRNYEIYRKDYQDLLDKQLNSQLSASLKGNQEGQHYRLVEPPSLPSMPSSPKRKRMSLIAFGAGLALGLMLAFLRDVLDGVFRHEDEIQKRLNVPVIVSLPVFTTPWEEKRKRSRHVVEWAGGLTLVLLLGVAEFLLIKR